MKPVGKGRRETCKNDAKLSRKKSMYSHAAKKRSNPAFWGRRQMGKCDQEGSHRFAESEERSDDG